MYKFQWCIILQKLRTTSLCQLEIRAIAYILSRHETGVGEWSYLYINVNI